MTKVTFKILNNGYPVKTFKTYPEAQAYKKINGGIIKTEYEPIIEETFNEADSTTRVKRIILSD